MNTTNPLFKSQIDLSNIRAVWLDVDQTLLDFDQSARYALIKTFERYHLDWKDEYFEIFLRENGKLWDQIEDGHLTRPQLRKIRFQVMFKAWQIPFDPPVEFEQYFSYDLHHCAFPMEGANQALDYFESLHLPLFIISNGPMEGQCNRLEMGGMLSRFTRVFTSESLGVAKPDPAFFQQALAQTNRDLHTSLNPDQILLSETPGKLISVVPWPVACLLYGYGPTANMTHLKSHPIRKWSVPMTGRKPSRL